MELHKYSLFPLISVYLCKTGGLIIKTISYTITEQLVQRPNGEHVTHPCSFLA